MTPEEEWRPVVGYEGRYEVSDLGRVRNAIRGNVLSPVVPHRDPRPMVSLGKRSAPKRVHALVATAFLGPRPNGMHVCHWNGDSTDNRLANLRYDNKSSNEQDKLRHGTHHNANKTECPHGHPYTPENTAIYDGRRFCKSCAADYQRARRRRRRAAT